MHVDGDETKTPEEKKAPFKSKVRDHAIEQVIVPELCESRGGTSWAVRPNEPSGFRGRKDLLHRASALVTTCP